MICSGYSAFLTYSASFIVLLYPNLNIGTTFGGQVNRGYLNVSPFIDVSSISVRDTDVRFLNEEELQLLNVTLEKLDLKDTFQKDARDLVLIYLFSGARTSEILYPSFTWDCIKKRFN